LWSGRASRLTLSLLTRAFRGSPSSLRQATSLILYFTCLFSGYPVFVPCVAFGFGFFVVVDVFGGKSRGNHSHIAAPARTVPKRGRARAKHAVGIRAPARRSRGAPRITHPTHTSTPSAGGLSTIHHFHFCQKTFAKSNLKLLSLPIVSQPSAHPTHTTTTKTIKPRRSG
jgi:hypothetical protein